jgi:hypothetical protein
MISASRGHYMSKIMCRVKGITKRGITSGTALGVDIYTPRRYQYSNYFNVSTKSAKPWHQNLSYTLSQMRYGEQSNHPCRRESHQHLQFELDIQRHENVPSHLLLKEQSSMYQYRQQDKEISCVWNVTSPILSASSVWPASEYRLTHSKLPLFAATRIFFGG